MHAQHRVTRAHEHMHVDDDAAMFHGSLKEVGDWSHDQVHTKKMYVAKRE